MFVWQTSFNFVLGSNTKSAAIDSPIVNLRVTLFRFWPPDLKAKGSEISSGTAATASTTMMTIRIFLSLSESLSLPLFGYWQMIPLPPPSSIAMTDRSDLRDSGGRGSGRSDRLRALNGRPTFRAPRCSVRDHWAGGRDGPVGRTSCVCRQLATAGGREPLKIPPKAEQMRERRRSFMRQNNRPAASPQPISK